MTPLEIILLVALFFLGLELIFGDNKCKNCKEGEYIPWDSRRAYCDKCGSKE